MRAVIVGIFISFHAEDVKSGQNAEKKSPWRAVIAMELPARLVTSRRADILAEFRKSANEEQGETLPNGNMYVWTVV